jgi:mannan endo-1,4-beta-mannosidase
VSIASQGVAFGAFTPIRAGGDQLEAVNALEQKLGRRLDVPNSFRKWGAPSGDYSSARISLAQARGAGRTPMVTWEPLLATARQGPYTLESIAQGAHDTYLRSWADGLAADGTEIFLRLMHEANGNWYPWSGNPKAYVAAWRHIVDLFARAGAENVRWVWCMNTSDQPKGNTLESYWPGADYVDVLGVDGYNCYGGWRPFGTILAKAYARLCALDADLPVWVCETATSEAQDWITGAAGHTKAEWIADLFATEGMERVELIAWFDSENPASYDWRIATSVQAQAELARQLRASAGWVPPPGPYVPPVPDRVVGMADGPGGAFVSWRVVRSFTRAYRVHHLEPDGTWTIAAVVNKPSTMTRIAGLTPGRHTFAVSTYTLVRRSALSLPVTVDVQAE